MKLILASVLSKYAMRRIEHSNIKLFVAKVGTQRVEMGEISNTKTSISL